MFHMQRDMLGSTCHDLHLTLVNMEVGCEIAYATHMRRIWQSNFWSSALFLKMGHVFVWCGTLARYGSLTLWCQPAHSSSNITPAPMPHSNLSHTCTIYMCAKAHGSHMRRICELQWVRDPAVCVRHASPPRAGWLPYGVAGGHVPQRCNPPHNVPLQPYIPQYNIHGPQKCRTGLGQSCVHVTRICEAYALLPGHERP